MITFGGVDIVLQQSRSADEIRTAIASVLSLSRERVAVIEDIGDYPATEAADVVCVSTPVLGEFTLLLSIQNEPLDVPFDNELALIERVSAILGTSCLAGTDDVDPYLMWLVAPGQSPQRVALDTVAYDEDRYVIERAA